MNEQQRQELEALERELGPQLDPLVPDDLHQRGKVALRLALDEEWFAAQSHPQPSIATTARIKTAIRRELVTRRRMRTYRLFGGAIAAAAAVVLAVSLSLSGPTRTNEIAPPAAKTPPIEDTFVDAFDAVCKDDPLDTLAEDIAWLDADMETLAADTAPDAFEVELDALQERIDGLMSDTDNTAGTL